MERINIRVDEMLKHQVEEEAREKGVSPSEIVRRALKEHLACRMPQLNARQLAERLGILGCYDGLPVDLSTNPDHMDGFGRG